MRRSLRKRVDVLSRMFGHDAERVLAALHVLIETGTAPEGDAGGQAADVWARSAELSTGTVMRRFWCLLQITGMTVSEYFAQRQERAEKGEA